MKLLDMYMLLLICFHLLWPECVCSIQLPAFIQYCNSTQLGCCVIGSVPANEMIIWSYPHLVWTLKMLQYFRGSCWSLWITACANFIILIVICPFHAWSLSLFHKAGQITINLFLEILTIFYLPFADISSNKLNEVSNLLYILPPL